MIKEIKPKPPKYPKNEWHSYFTWFPLTFTDHDIGVEFSVWLETIERKFHDAPANYRKINVSGFVEYRLKR